MSLQKNGDARCEAGRCGSCLQTAWCKPACEVLPIDRSSVRYHSIRPDDADIREAMKLAASKRRRFGYRRIHVMLGRRGIVMILKKLRVFIAGKS